MNAQTPAAPAEAMAATPAPRRRSRARLLMWALPLALATGGAWAVLGSGATEATENANLHQARLLIAADLPGRVVEVDVADNQHVREGDVMFRLDPEPGRIALAQAEAAVAAARVQVAQLQSAYAAAVAQRDLARTDLDYVTTEAARQSTLTKRGVGTAATLDSSQHDLERARQVLAAAEVGVGAAAAALGGSPEAPVDAHPLVQQALAGRDRAAYALTQTELRAPADGVVTQASSFRAGQFVAAGTPVFSLVATGDAWVDANFKETQLAAISPGSRATVTFDAFPDRPFAATVDAVGAGTGAEFSLLPAQNATGNWVKVTQRVPVRLHLGEGQDTAALRSGMSAKVVVETGRQTPLQRLAARAQAAMGGVRGQ